MGGREGTLCVSALRLTTPTRTRRGHRRPPRAHAHAHARTHARSLVATTLPLAPPWGDLPSCGRADRRRLCLLLRAMTMTTVVLASRECFSAAGRASALTVAVVVARQLPPRRPRRRRRRPSHCGGGSAAAAPPKEEWPAALPPFCGSTHPSTRQQQQKTTTRQQRAHNREQEDYIQHRAANLRESRMHAGMTSGGDARPPITKLTVQSSLSPSSYTTRQYLLLLEDQGLACSVMLIG